MNRTPVFLSVLLSALLSAGMIGGAYYAVRSGLVPLGPDVHIGVQRDPAPATQPATVAPARIDAASEDLTVRDRSVVDVVRRASPSVVSIVISRDLPKYQRSMIDPFGNVFDPFGGLQPNLRIPVPDSGDDQPSTEKQKVGAGSGFFVSADGLILTNKHVVTYTDAEYTVVLSDGQTLPAKVLARDPSNDLAIIKVERVDGKDFPALPLGDSGTIQIGQTVIAIGNALAEFQNTVSVGVVSGLSRSITAGGAAGFTEQLEGVIQTDAAINPGNSGGPMLDLDGRVLGINSAVAQGAQSIGFAIVINDAKKDIESVQKSGRIVRAYMGVRYISLNEDIAKENRIATTEGALILRGDDRSSLAVVPGSPADKAGLVENDIITKVDGTAVTAKQPLWRLIAGKDVGDVVTLTVLSKGAEKTVSVKLEAQPDAVQPTPSDVPDGAGGR